MGVDPSLLEASPHLGGVTAVVIDCVRPSASHLGVRTQDAHEVAVGEHRARAARKFIEGARDADAEPLHAARQLSVAVGLEDEVDVGPLD